MVRWVICMKILKYKKAGSGKYLITLDDNKELKLYEDVILKYELLLKKDIPVSILPEIEAYNNECDVYYVALKSLKSRFKSSWELRKMLLSKEYPNDFIDIAIKKLESQGYLNDRSFARAYINNQIITSSKGPSRIIKDLIAKGIDNKIIYDEINVFDEDTQIEKIEKIIRTSIKSNRNKGGNVLKKKIVNDLINSGYSYEVISKVIDNYEFNNTADISKREYDKLYKKLSRKYSGKELEYKIKEKLYQKGLNYEEIY